MTAVLNQVTKYLDHRGWKYRIEPERSCIITGVVAEHVERFLIAIHVKDEGKVLSLVAPQLLAVKDHVHKEALLQTMLGIAWEVELLRWEYDPMDGEVRASINLILEDNPLTEQQFNRALEALIQLVDQVAMPRLQLVLATGTDPGIQGMEASANQLLERLNALIPEAELADLQAELACLQSSDAEHQG